VASLDPALEAKPKSTLDQRHVQATPRSWQEVVVAEYIRSADDWRAHLQRRLVVRLQELTGCVPQELTGCVPVERTIVADAAARRATAVVDGVVFYLRGRDMVVVRPCTHCGAGLFESPPVENRSDLGYALAAWAPYHPDCAPTDPPDDASW
jgi:hypothetical protein